MKTKELMSKFADLLEKEGLDNLMMDTFYLNQIIKIIDEDIGDIRLKLSLEESINKIRDNYAERDLEEEAKKEFYCSGCSKFKPINEYSGHRERCIKCFDEEESEEDFFE